MGTGAGTGWNEATIQPAHLFCLRGDRRDSEDWSIKNAYSE